MVFPQEIPHPGMALSWADLPTTFCSYFPNRHKSILKPQGARSWVTLSKFHRLDDAEILAAVGGRHSSFRGCRWDDITRFAVLDIDEGSQYHNQIGLRKLFQDLASLALFTTRLYQSSISGGWHLYIPFSQWVSSSELEAMLKRVLKLKGYSITGGQLEVFPSNNGLRLPLQAGFAWIDQNGSIMASRDEISFEDAISRFVADIETTENDWEYTKSRIAQALSEHASQLGSQLYEERLSTEGMDVLYSCKLIEENYNLGKHYWLNGLSSAGERHQAIICIEHMLWHGCDELSVPAYPGSFNDQERFRILCQWLKRSHNGHCRHILEGKWETVEAQIQRACSWRTDKTAERTPYTLVSDSAIDRIAHLSRKTGRTWTLEDWRKANQRRQDAAIKRIEKALKELHLSGQLITISSVSRQSGTDRKTVRKYKYLLAAWGSDQNLGGGLLSALSQEELECPDRVLDLSEKKEFPIHTGLVSPAFSSDLPDGCLTPCAEHLVRRRRTTDGMDLWLGSPPSPRPIKAQGSSTGLEGLRYAFGEFFLFRLRSGQLRHGGEQSEEDRRSLDFASGPQEKDRVCDLIGTAFKGSRSNVFSLRGGIIGGGNETALPAAAGGLGSEVPSGDRSRDAEAGLIALKLNKLEQSEVVEGRTKSAKQSALDSPVPDSESG